MDAMLNFVFTNDTSCHVCEIQVVLKDLMLARSQFGGHQVYGLGRLAAELLELAAVHSPWKNHIGLLCLQEFCKGYDIPLLGFMNWKGWGTEEKLQN